VIEVYIYVYFYVYIRKRPLYRMNSAGRMYIFAEEVVSGQRLKGYFIALFGYSVFVVIA